MLENVNQMNAYKKAFKKPEYHNSCRNRATSNVKAPQLTGYLLMCCQCNKTFPEKFVGMIWPKWEIFWCYLIEKKKKKNV